MQRGRHVNAFGEIGANEIIGVFRAQIGANAQVRKVICLFPRACELARCVGTLRAHRGGGKPRARCNSE